MSNKPLLVASLRSEPGWRSLGEASDKSDKGERDENQSGCMD